MKDDTKQIWPELPKGSISRVKYRSVGYTHWFSMDIPSAGWERKRERKEGEREREREERVTSASPDQKKITQK